MPPRTRALIAGIGISALLPLLMLALWAPPNGGERAEFVQFVGRFHLLVIHLPITLLLLVPLLECAAFLHKQWHLRQSVGFVLGLAAVSAILSAWLGWLLAWSGGYEGPLVLQHMWGGVLLACAALACWLLYTWKRSIYAVALLPTVALLIWTGDQGGKLTHGDTFLTEHAPAPLRRWIGRPQRVEIDPASFYATRVQPIFEQKCVVCHNAGKFKGKLRLDSYEHVMRGGKDGPVIRPGDASASELVRRTTLPPESKDFMPAEGKPALSAAEIKLLQVWISAGATTNISQAALRQLPSSSGKIASVPMTADYRPRLAIITRLEGTLGVHLVPRSQIPTDGLILRTASGPGRCNDATLQQLAPIADLIVDAELARTSVTDKGLRTIAAFSNLRFLDLSHTAVTSAGVMELMKLGKLESLNLTATQVKQDAATKLRAKPSLKRLYIFETS